MIFAAGIFGWLAGRAGIASFTGGGGHAAKVGATTDADSALGTEIPEHARARLGRISGASLPLLAVWLIPVGLLVAFAPADSAFAQIATFSPRWRC